ncbi:MAG: hypothetical protein ACTMUB_10105 [cyanobacterium endosymbiont of Rhopalodia musculus]|uniref:hypothetical protein n=1 Tax=cyanobacterium endosymbiont of Epithemia clementina EcSB TaxID=3034674 RepID=UPI00247FE146|nr:hypothetical protein [cyanobacterium endosymbiont of Epithemia clementina EcSB]WGT68380.1 hypothetical protein P3F56_04890 [cyanobacterium endosymbiont of Epithemia clementina EcSB]
MNIKKQLEILANNAPEYGVSIEIMEQAVNPVLKFFANQHKQTDYFVLHTSDRHWIITTLNNRKQPQITKRVVYGFVSHQDARNFQDTVDPSSVNLPIDIVSIPITHLFFQMFAIRQVDSIILMDNPNNQTQGIEIQREDIENMIQKQLQQVTPNHFLKIKNTPPNLA